MAKPTLQKELLDTFAALPGDKRRRLVAYAKSLRHPKPGGVKGSELLKFAGCISSKTADKMLEAIKDFERIDEDAW